MKKDEGGSDAPSGGISESQLEARGHGVEMVARKEE